MAQITYSALFAYYRRIADEELAEFFMRRVIEYGVRSVGIIGTLKVFISRIVEKVKERF